MARNKFVATFETESDDSSSDEEEIPVADLYKILDIRAGLLNPIRYSTVVYELQALISSRYSQKRRGESAKELTKLLEADVQLAIFQFNFGLGEIAHRNLRSLMKVVDTTFPQAKRQALVREFKQKMLQLNRDEKKLRQQQEKEQENSPQERHSFANLPEECIVNIFSLLKNDPRSLVTAAMTCTTWNTLATSNSLWKRLANITFGRVEIPQEINTDETEEGYYYRVFSKLASSQGKVCVLPWKTDRIICHDTIRWCSSETRARVIQYAERQGIAIVDIKSANGVTFIPNPEGVVLYLATGKPSAVVLTMTMAPALSQMTIVD